MCGIFGQLALGGGLPDPVLLEQGLLEVRHRGPDDHGFLKDGPLGMGAMRLSVIDIQGGHQPLSNEDGTVWVVFNGEIYNHLELRGELIGRGHTFRTESDTEVLVHLYEEEPEGFLERLNGMFALAVWDKKRQRLVLARDRVGMKPLFISEWQGSLYFASEMKSILSLPSFPKDWDYQALNDYFSFYYVTAPRTMYEHIRRIMPGECLTIESGRIARRRYWNYTFKEDRDTRPEDLVEAFPGLLERSVERHLQSDVPVGVYLSSGLDSAGIVAMMSRLHDNIKTFTVGYSEDSYSELDIARLISRRFGTDHNECILTPELFRELLPRVINQLDEPHGDWTHVAIYRLSQIARDEVTVVLCGAGGDELFGGYPTLTAARIAALYRRLPAVLRRHVINPLVGALPTSYRRMSLDFKAKSFVAGADLVPERAHMRFKEVFDVEKRRRLFSRDLQDYIPEEDAFRVFEQHLEGTSEQEIINRLMYLDLKVFLPDCTLYSMDIMTSANSLECRAPLLDMQMLDFAARVPWKWKIRGLTTKYLVRRAMKPYLPSECVRMPKKGFLVPAGPWLRGPLLPFAREVIGDTSGGSHLFNRDEIDRLLQEHVDGRMDHTRRLTCLLSFLLWAD